jgi:hypothetical protein
VQTGLVVKLNRTFRYFVGAVLGGWPWGAGFGWPRGGFHFSKRAVLSK